MRHLLLAFAFGFCVFAADDRRHDHPPLPAGTQPGRFWIASAVYDGMGAANKVTLRIDSVTGQTWRLTDRQTDNGIVASWVPIKENVPALAPERVKIQNPTAQPH
jgi:hypothetical protein